MNLPLISVIVPNFNYARFLEKRLVSIFNQTYQDFEVIILDNCSSDNSREIIEKYNKSPKITHIIYNESNNGNIFKQWNKGIKLSRGKYIWIAESDDYADKIFLETLVNILETKNNIGLVFARSCIVDDNDKSTTYLGLSVVPDYSGRYYKSFENYGHDECINHLYDFNYIYNASAVLFRNDLLIRKGLADENMILCGDWITWLKILSISDIYFWGEKPLNYFRWHKNTNRSMAEGTFIGLSEYISVLDFLLLNFNIDDENKSKYFDSLLYKYLYRYVFRGKIKTHEFIKVYSFLKKLDQNTKVQFAKAIIKAILFWRKNGSTKEEVKKYFKKLGIFYFIKLLINMFYLIRGKYIFFYNFIYNLIIYLKNKKPFDSSGIVVFKITDSNLSLTVFPMMFFFNVLGYNIKLKYHYKFISGCFYGAKNIFRLKKFKISFKLDEDKNEHLTISNNEFKEARIDEKKHGFILQKITFPQKIMSDSIIPYPMHPDIYYMGLYKKIPEYRRFNRNVRIFFSGNTTKQKYLNTFNENYSVKLTRIQIIEKIKKAFTKEVLSIVESEEEINEIISGMGNFTGKFILNDWQWSKKRSKNLKLRIPTDHWLETLARCDFFLACPGMQIPFSHNIIEAMSVGAIPVVGYAHLFYPQLEHNVNCICFDDEDDLIKKLFYVINMNQIEICRLRENVFIYYDTYLDYSKYTSEFISNPIKSKIWKVYAENF